MTVQIGQLHKKRIVRRMNGQIIDMVDEANGGVIIKGGQVVNQERFDELKRIEEDKIKAARAQAEGVVAPQAQVEERTQAPTKVQELEKKVEEQDKKLDMILELLKKK